MSTSDTPPPGPVCLFDHGPMQPVDENRWECILCSFVVIEATPEQSCEDAGGDGSAA